MSSVITGENFFVKSNRMAQKNMNEIFSEHFARRDNPLTRVDARIKMIFVIGAITTVISSPVSSVPLIVTLLVMVNLFNVKIPFKIIMFRLSAPMGIAITVLFIKIFIFHQAPAEVVLIVSKIIASTSLVLFLSMTTSVDKALAACRWFKVPGIWVEICLITYRYIFVLLEDAVTVLDAQRIRLGYTNLTCALRSVGVLSGAIIIRAYDQSIATYEAMMLRGYKGKAQIPDLEDKATLRDMVTGSIFIVILASLIILNGILKA